VEKSEQQAGVGTSFTLADNCIRSLFYTVKSFTAKTELGANKGTWAHEWQTKIVEILMFRQISAVFRSNY